MHRRRFVQAGATLMGSALVVGCEPSERSPGGEAETAPREPGPPPSPPTRPLGPVGIQLYTLRSLMEANVPGTLEQVAAIGYREVEFAGYFGRSAAELRALLDGLGLVAPAAHVDLGAMRDRTDAVLADALELGHTYVVVPWLPEAERSSLDGYRRLGELFNRFGARCRAEGLTFAYHNQEYDFARMDGQRPYDVLLQETEPELVALELDLYWAIKGEADPLRYFAAHPGRFPLCHVKDMSASGDMVDVGDGAMDFAAILAASSQAGLRHYFVEHDTPDDPLATAARSYAHLSGLRI